MIVGDGQVIATGADAEAIVAAEDQATAERDARPRSEKKERLSFMQRFEATVSRLSTRNHFWHKLCSWFYLPFAYRSGIKMTHEDSAWTAILPFRRFNRNWYSAMAGAALLGNSEIAGGSFVFRECGGNFRVVCKELTYRFLRPCVGPAMYRITPQQDLGELSAGGGEFNVTLEMEIVQVMRTPNERERRVGRCVATFHATPITQHRKRKYRQQWRDRRKLRGKAKNNGRH